MHDPNKPIDRQYVDDVPLDDNEEDLEREMCIDPERCYDIRGECGGRCQLNAREDYD